MELVIHSPVCRATNLMIDGTTEGSTMPTLIVTRGLPGSGKTTWARQRLGTDMVRAARINRDDLRRSLHGGLVGADWAERQVTLAQHAAVAELLRSGVDVICDDTNLRARVVRSFAEIARDCGADFVVRDFTDVPLDVCIERDAVRPPSEQVGADVITGMWRRYLAGKPTPLPVPRLEEPPGPPARMHSSGAGLPEAILVDIDGTVALMGDRSPYDMTRVGEDRPNHAVITAVRAMYAFGHHIVFCTGRSDDCRDVTQRWLEQYVGVPYQALFMRATGDDRKDSIVKGEIFEREIRHRWAVTGVFDDRAQVVRMWRSLGLTVFQVADGNF
jgi:predicted kinase